MSFFDNDHDRHDFHWLAGMLSSMGLLVIAAVFIGSGGLTGGPGSVVAQLSLSPQSLGAFAGIGDLCVWPLDCSGGPTPAQTGNFAATPGTITAGQSTTLG